MSKLFTTLKFHYSCKGSAPSLRTARVSCCAPEKAALTDLEEQVREWRCVFSSASSSLAAWITAWVICGPKVTRFSRRLEHRWINAKAGRDSPRMRQVEVS